MSFKRMFYWFFFLPTFIFLQSCSEDNSTINSTNGPTTKNYFPTTVGSWWIYKSYDLDSNGVNVPESETYDTNRIVGSFNIAGKMATAIEIRSSNGSVDTSFFYYENNKIYSLISIFNNDLIPIEGDQWIMVADFNSSAWTILKDTTLGSFNMPGYGTITPTLGITGRKGNSTNVVVKGKVIPSQEFIITMKINIQISIQEYPLPINATVEVLNHIFFGENVGNVGTQTDPSVLNVVIFQEKIPGHRSELIDYSIK